MAIKIIAIENSSNPIHNETGVWLNPSDNQNNEKYRPVGIGLKHFSLSADDIVDKILIFLMEFYTQKICTNLNFSNASSN